jgi:sarcosine oxidase subunit beta
MRKTYDIIVIGAGSVGCPLTFFLAREGMRVLVIDRHASPGQGQNKAAIGGVRATHSDPAKIQLCLDSIGIFSTWKQEHGIDIGWKQGGYCFPALGEREENILRGLLATQKAHGLDIDWVDGKTMRELVPGIREEGLRGGTFSPGDGQVSPLKAAPAFIRAARGLGAHARFRELVLSVRKLSGGTLQVTTDRGTYQAGRLVVAAGAEASEVGGLLGIELPVVPDSHEAGITAPVKPFLGPLVVDIRPGVDGKTANFYFGQNSEGQIIFCYTPSQLFVGTNRESTSEFMPILARRIVSLVPSMKNLLVRRVWRGLYPMTPDGVIIVDRVREIEGLYVAVGMCGQGMMLGPGVARCLTEFMLRGRPTIDPDVFSGLSLYRDFRKAKKEALK